MIKQPTILLSLLVLTSLFVFFIPHQPQISTKQEQLFQQWVQTYAKRYSQLGEKQYRKGIWLTNYYFVQSHQNRFQAGEESYELEMNLFSDLSSAQFAQKYLMTNYNSKSNPHTATTPKNTNKCNGRQPPELPLLPDSIDWSAKGAVTGIKDQGQCGSCWAFSATGALEGAKYKQDGKLVGFSEQQLVDCSHEYENYGCQGGYMEHAFHYVIDHGIATQDKYPYKGVAGSCHYEPSDKAYQIYDCTNVTTLKQKSLLAAIAQQPTSVAIQANHLSFQLYKSGVYTGNCGTKLDHGVLAVGYGAIDGKLYYKVKNSWGARWGAQGYIYIVRNGDGKGKCGIQMEPSFPVV